MEGACPTRPRPDHLLRSKLAIRKGSSDWRLEQPCLAVGLDPGIVVAPVAAPGLSARPGLSADRYLVAARATLETAALVCGTLDHLTAF
jgi:hypothetical protein